MEVNVVPETQPEEMNATVVGLLSTQKHTDPRHITKIVKGEMCSTNRFSLMAFQGWLNRWL